MGSIICSYNPENNKDIEYVNTDNSNKTQKKNPCKKNKK